MRRDLDHLPAARRHELELVTRLLFAEDRTGSGHTWTLPDDTTWRHAYVVIHDLDAVPFTPDRERTQ